jgi:hypothetical protein
MVNFYKFLNILNEQSDDGWPEEEAYGEAEYVLELIKDAQSGIEEIENVKKHIEKLYTHWNRVFDDKKDLSDFIAKFNSMMPSKEFHIKDPNDTQTRMF